MIYYKCSVSCSLHSFLSLSVFGGLFFYLQNSILTCHSLQVSIS
nr:MAG TPA: hypothetical protein [Caudoviricetes sp.]